MTSDTKTRAKFARNKREKVAIFSYELTLSPKLSQLVFLFDQPPLQLTLRDHQIKLSSPHFLITPKTEINCLAIKMIDMCNINDENSFINNEKSCLNLVKKIMMERK